MKRFERILPRYAYVPLFIAVVFNMLTYYGTRLVNTSMHHYDISLPLDDLIPFVPQAIVVYVLAFVTWLIGFVVIARESRKVCYRILSAELVAKMISFLIFIILPTSMQQPEITGDDIFSRLTQLIYDLDSPDNLFPSLHCLESYIVFRGALYCKKPSKWYTPFCLVFALMVFASTVLIKQHLLLDIPGAVIIAEIGMFVSSKLRLSRIYERLEPRWARQDEPADTEIINSN